MNSFLRSFLKPVVGSVLLITSFFEGIGQPNSSPYKIAQDRLIWHDKVDQEQQKLVVLGGGQRDSMIRLSKDETVTLHITDALGRRVDELKQQTEYDSTLNTNGKKRYLKGLAFLLGE